MLSGARLVQLVVYVSDLGASRAFYEGALGFRVLDQDADSVHYAAGHVVLALRRAADHGVRLREGQDRSIDLTFLADDFDAVRAALEARGVALSPTLDYAVGKTADFYDPDGHWFSLYQPSAAAMGWPSGRKIAALRGSAGARGGAGGGAGLDGLELVYLFLFVRELEATEAFYHGTLGLVAVEGGPCKRVATSAPVGVVKYDAGGTLLTTHHVEGDRAARHRVTTRGSGGVALVFHGAELDALVDGLARRGVAFAGPPETSPAGRVAKFADPAGHVYHLYEPSSAALARPFGAALRRTLAAQLGDPFPISVLPLEAAGAA